MRPLSFGGGLAIAAFFISLGGCAHLQDGSTPYTSPTPTGTVGPSNAPCVQTPTTGAQIVAITPSITATIDPTYGLINGYGLVVGGSTSNVATVIAVQPTDIIQFFDNDSTTSNLTYSAVGIPGVTAFPNPLTFTFPASAAQQTGTQINNTTTWSTGLMAGGCYSQPFTISGTGAFFFGDYTYYSLANLRDVIVASTAAPQSIRRR